VLVNTTLSKSAGAGLERFRPGNGASRVVAAVDIVVVQDGLLVGVGRGGSGRGRSRGSQRSRGFSGSGFSRDGPVGGRVPGGCASGIGSGSILGSSRGGLGGSLLAQIDSGQSRGQGRRRRRRLSNNGVLLDQVGSVGGGGRPLGDSFGDSGSSPVSHVNFFFNDLGTGADREGGEEQSGTHFANQKSNIAMKETSPGSIESRDWIKQIDC
jgi:hypothetical protein